MNDCRLQSLRVTPRTSNEPSFGLAKILTEIYNDFSDYFYIKNTRKYNPEYSFRRIPRQRSYRCDSTGDYYLGDRRKAVSEVFFDKWSFNYACLWQSLPWTPPSSSLDENSISTFWIYMIMLPLLQVLICMAGAWLHDTIAKEQSFLGQCPSLGDEDFTPRTWLSLKISVINKF